MNLVRKVHRHHIFALLASPCTEVHRAPRCTTTCVHLHLGASRWLAHRAAPCTGCIACAKHPHRDASTSDCTRVHGAAPVVTRVLIDPHVPSSPPTDTCIPQNNHSPSNTISFLAVSDLLRLFPAVSGHILTFTRALDQSDAGDTAEYTALRPRSSSKESNWKVVSANTS